MSLDKVDRRRFLRIQFPFTIHLYPIGDPPISAYAEDISSGGVKVTVHQRFEVSSLIKMEIYVKLRPITCQGRVTWINERESEFLEGETLYDLGIEFQELKSEDTEAIEERLGKITQDREVREEIEN